MSSKAALLDLQTEIQKEVLEIVNSPKHSAVENYGNDESTGDGNFFIIEADFIFFPSVFHFFKSFCFIRFILIF